MKLRAHGVLVQAFLLVPLAAAAARGGGDGLQPGALAPAHELHSFIQGEMRALADLRGRVVVLHTFAWNCDSCLRKGIPLSVELQQAHAPEELAMLSITTPAERENTLRIMQQYGVTQPVAAANPMGDVCPYVDMANGITYMWVIGRNGQIAWRGDPSTKEEECLEAVRAALADRADRTLARPLAPALDEAAGHYAAGAYRDAKEAADKLQKEHARKQDPASQAIAADAAFLSERVTARLAELTAALEKAAAERDAESFVAQRAELALGFPKSDWAAAQASAAAAAHDLTFAAAVAEAEAWRALKAERPALYGVRRDKSAERFAATLKDFLAQHGSSAHAEEARAWLALGEKAAAGR